jgi:hypothetical protein
MSTTFFDRFKQLPICFEYFYKQLSALTFHKVTCDKIDELVEVSKLLNLTREETLVWAVVFYLQYEMHPADPATINQLVAPVIGKNADVYEIIKFFEKLEVMEKDYESKNRVVRFSNNCFKMIKSSDLSAIKQIKPIGLEMMLNYFNVHVIKSKYQSVSSIRNELDVLIELNPELNLVKHVFKAEMDLNAFVIGAVCALRVHERRSFNTGFINKYIIDYLGENHFLLNEIASGDWKYIKNGWISIVSNGLMNNEVELDLTELGLRNLMPELNSEILNQLIINEDEWCQNLIKPEHIQEKQLYFSDKMNMSIKMLEMLFHKHFNDERIASSSDKGICMLFHGASGTGKTELVLQMTKRSNRALFKIDISQVLSKWVGESEQKLKSLFSKYKRLVKQMKIAPVLFLNECDQLLSKRINVSNSVDQMNNNLQNILLEELENFEGLLVATTNLIQNLDSAFERRFLFKLQFDKPDNEIKLKLWKSYLYQLSDEELLKLQKEFDFTPAEIRNVARKLALFHDIDISISTFELALHFCRSERLSQTQSTKIGF